MILLVNEKICLHRIDFRRTHSHGLSGKEYL
jgi:hypothetical protein